MILGQLITHWRQFSFTIRGIRYPLYRKRRNIRRPPIHLYWWYDKDINNFGDLVSQDIIFQLFGYNTTWSPPANCDLIAAGSIIEIVQSANRQLPLYVWGSGFIKSSSSQHKPSNFIFTAVRGKKTLRKIHPLQKLPTSDPGILINAVYLLKKKRRSSKIGVVIHYADKNTAIARKIRQDPRFTIINPLDNPKHVAQQISECGLVLSSSLHGLIFADSLSIPNAHIKISDNLTGGTFKFQDYYSGIGKPYLAADPNKIFDNAYLKQLKQIYRPIPHLSHKQRLLVKAFPFH